MMKKILSLFGSNKSASKTDPYKSFKEGMEAYNEYLKIENEPGAKNEKEQLMLLDKAIAGGVTLAHSPRAWILQIRGFDYDALEDFNTAIKLVDHNANDYFGRAMSKSRTGDYIGALVDLKRANELINEDNVYSRAYKENAHEIGIFSVPALYKNEMRMVVRALKEQLEDYDSWKTTYGKKIHNIKKRVE